jgi:hypothetical protein
LIPVSGNHHHPAAGETTTMTYTTETILARYADRNTDPIPAARAERLTKAVELGATDAVLEQLCDAVRTSTTDTRA